MKKLALVTVLIGGIATSGWAGSYAPAAGQVNSTAIAYDSPAFQGWASGVVNFTPGFQDISDPSLGLVTYGVASDALWAADAEIDSLPVVSLGDGGSITLSFDAPITDGPGADFAVFENGINDTFLELAFVEVSSDGVNFFRFASVSQTPTASQIGSFGALDATNLNNLAGKYRRGFGTPFDLSELSGVSGLDITHVLQIRVVDVVGSSQLDPGSHTYLYARFDSLSNPINDPWTTPFETGGFDLDAIGVIHYVPEPGCLLGIGALMLGASIRIRRQP